MWRFVVVAALSVGLTAAEAHKAPSGWQYPNECCNETDCHPVSCDALREVEGGVAFLEWTFKKDMIKASQDGFCHVCIGHYGPSPAQAKPHCLFMTPRT